jgi:hypothetical protein
MIGTESTDTLLLPDPDQYQAVSTSGKKNCGSLWRHYATYKQENSLGPQKKVKRRQNGITT